MFTVRALASGLAVTAAWGCSIINEFEDFVRVAEGGTAGTTAASGQSSVDDDSNGGSSAAGDNDREGAAGATTPGGAPSGAGGSSAAGGNDREGAAGATTPGGAPSGAGGVSPGGAFPEAGAPPGVGGVPMGGSDGQDSGAGPGGATVGGAPSGGIEPGGAPGTQTGGAGPVDAPVLTIVPEAQSFPSVALGSASSGTVFTVTNEGDVSAGTTTELTVELAGIDAAEFQVDATTCTGTLTGGSSCTVTVSFTPTSASAKSAALTVAAEPGGSATATVSGTGLTPGSLAIQPQTMSFAGTVAGSTSAAASFEVSNTGATSVGTAIGLAAALTGTDATEFVITGDACMGTLAPAASCTVQVAFQPTASGAKSATLTVGASPGGNVSSALSGEAIPPCSLTTDGVCPSGCTYSNDYDCKKADGDTCSSVAECRSSVCTFGTCCGDTMTCPECQSSSDCVTDANQPICAGGICVSCGSMGTQAADNAACAARSAALPVCGSLGACVQCTSSSHCTVETTPICSNNQCVACSLAEQCTAKDPNRLICLATGACVECSGPASHDCVQIGDPLRPVCGPNNFCVPCNEVVNPVCGYWFESVALNKGPGCDGETGRCVQCLAGNSCKTEVVISVTRDAQGLCANDHTTCEPVRCTVTADCNTAAQYECYQTYCVQPQ